MQNKIQGQWQVVSLFYGLQKQDKDITLVFDKNELQRIENGKKWKRRIEFDRSNPDWISIIPTTEPLLGLTLLGRIKVKNNRLHLIHAWPGEHRPTDFIPKEDTNAVLLIAERFKS